MEATRAAQADTASASPAGQWKIATTGPDGNPITLILTLKSEDGKWSGQLVVEEYNMTLPVSDIKVDGAKLGFKVPSDQGTYEIDSTVNGAKLEGTSAAPDGTKSKITGTRQ